MALTIAADNRSLFMRILPVSSEATLSDAL
jgi:hypothetical protein